MKKSFLLAVMNIKNYRAQNRLFSVILFFCMTLFIITFTIANGFINISKEYKTDDRTLREVEIWNENAKDLDTESLKKIASKQEVIDASQPYNVELNSPFNIKVNGDIIKSLPMIRGFRRGFSLLPNYQSEKNDKDTDLIKYGRNFDFNDKKKAIIDENICYLLGYKDPSELIGKKINILLSDTLVNNIEIVGVCSYLCGYFYEDLKDVDDFSRASYLESEMCNPVFFSDDIIQFISESSDYRDFYYENFKVLIDNTDHVKNFCRDVTDTYEYTTSNLIYQIETKAKEVRSISFLLYLVTLIIFLIAISCIINTMIIKIDNQKKFSEMLMKIGYKKNNISFVYIFENMIVTAKTGIYAFLSALAISVCVDAYLYKGYQEISSKEKYIFLMDPEKAIIFLIGIILFIVLITIIISFTQLKKIGRAIKNGR